MLPADEVEMRLREIWEDTRQIATRVGNTYGVDQVGKCIQAVRDLATAAQRAYHQPQGPA
jgi:hypothetical protein